MRKKDLETLGRGGVAINLLGLACVVMAISFTVLTATSSANSLGEAVRDALIFGVVAAYGLLMATTSVQVRGDDLVLVRLLAIATLPLNCVSQVSGENGLEVSTRDGRKLSHIGYGSSLIGTLTGNRRSTRVAGRIRGVLPPEMVGVTLSNCVSRRPRAGLGLLVVLPLALAAVAATLH